MSPRVLAVLVATAALSCPAPCEAATRRLALVVGSNAGSGARPPLRFAESDAAKLARALVEVGQVAQPDVLLLLAPTLEELEKGFDALQAAAQRLRAGDDRVLATFYFSGHSDGEALELGGQRFPVSRLKARMAQLGADVRLTIVDACRSGAAVEAKGGRRAPAFDIRLADDLVATGEVVLASSAAHELALESPEVRGSYFTHYLVSGLRGAADASGDGQVTLGEAYRFAYDHTVAATSATLHDPQHPTYDFKLTGQGELVLSVLSEPNAGLELPEGFERALVLDLARDQVVAEAPAGAPRRVALPAGRYAVRARREGAWWSARVQVSSGEVRQVGWAQLSAMSAPEVAARGEAQTASAPASDVAAGPALLLSLGAAMGSSDPVTVNGMARLSLDVRLGSLLFVGAAAIGAAGWGAMGTSEAHGQLRALVGLHWRLGLLSLFGALELGGGVVQAVGVGGAALSWGAPIDFVGVGALRAGLRLRLGEHARLEAALEGDALVGGDLARRFLPAVTLGAGAEF